MTYSIRWSRKRGVDGAIPSSPILRNRTVKCELLCTHSIATYRKCNLENAGSSHLHIAYLCLSFANRHIHVNCKGFFTRECGALIFISISSIVFEGLYNATARRCAVCWWDGWSQMAQYCGATRHHTYNFNVSALVEP